MRVYFLPKLVGFYSVGVYFLPKVKYVFSVGVFRGVTIDNSNRVAKRPKIKNIGMFDLIVFWFDFFVQNLAILDSDEVILTVGNIISNFNTQQWTY